MSNLFFCGVYRGVTLVTGLQTEWSSEWWQGIDDCGGQPVGGRIIGRFNSRIRRRIHRCSRCHSHNACGGGGGGGGGVGSLVVVVYAAALALMSASCGPAAVYRSGRPFQLLRCSFSSSALPDTVITTTTTTATSTITFTITITVLAGELIILSIGNTAANSAPTHPSSVIATSSPPISISIRIIIIITISAIQSNGHSSIGLLQLLLTIFPALVALVAVSTPPVAAGNASVVYYWDIQYIDNVSPYGGPPKRVIGVNGDWPLPTLQASEGDTLSIVVRNSLDVPTALHARGLLQSGQPWMDGMPMVSQCPIAPGFNYTYTYEIRQHGTFLIEGLYNGQLLDGLRAPLIIKAPKELTSYDAEYVVTVSDWYDLPATTVKNNYLSLFNPMGDEPLPDFGLLNEMVNASVSFTPGLTYRLRIVSMSAFGAFNFAIDGHNMTVIELDGVDTQPSIVSSLTLSPGQRVSVLVDALPLANVTAIYYAIRAPLDLFGGPPRPCSNSWIVYNLPAEKSAALTAGDSDGIYTGPAAATPPAQNLDGLVSPAVEGALWEPVTLNGSIELSLSVRGDGGSTWSSNAAIALDARIYGPASNAWVVSGNDVAGSPNVVEVTFFNNFGHPLGLTFHGHLAQVVEVPTNVKGSDRSLVGTFSRNGTVMRRDTVWINPGRWVIVRLRINLGGLGLAMIESPHLLPPYSAAVAQADSTCGALGIQATGNAAGHVDNPLDLLGANEASGPVPTGVVGWRGWVLVVACVAAGLAGLVVTATTFAGGGGHRRRQLPAEEPASRGDGSEAASSLSLSSSPSPSSRRTTRLAVPAAGTS
ncbi:Cupredoxin [Zopfochytrium polystomum]|nr:Cupredoxin [Zopfochytrium polystomum]